MSFICFLCIFFHMMENIWILHGYESLFAFGSFVKINTMHSNFGCKHQMHIMEGLSKNDVRLSYSQRRIVFFENSTSMSIIYSKMLNTNFNIDSEMTMNSNCSSISVTTSHTIVGCDRHPCFFVIVFQIIF